MSPPYRVVVVDDEPLARTGVAALVRADPELTVVGECGDGASAVETIRRLRPDLLLLDVQMPELDGFEVLQRLDPHALPAVIFITAYDQFAVGAFDVQAVDYLVKPFDDARFAAAIARAKAAIRSAGSPSDGWISRIVVKTAGRVVLVRVEDIDWIEAADYCVKLHVQGKVHVHRESLQALELRLDPARFFRIHRSGIVNLDRVAELQPFFKGESAVLLRDGNRVRLSRGRRRALELRLRQSV
ncbi:MAG TPA: LytTR family DNA-binding domain-containing protein [Gemmatimonadales bacterium]|nr:LytTR family DNA-binding domain-containing protein [Gemmatimonadales bacterium]